MPTPHATFLDTLILIAVLHFLLFSLFLLTRRGGKQISSRLFALFLLLKAFCYLDSVLAILFPAGTAWIYSLRSLSTATDLLLGPSLLLYTRSLIYSDFRLRAGDFRHALPSLAVLISLIPIWHTVLSESAATAQAKHREFLSYLHHFANLHFIAYSIGTLSVLMLYRRRLRQWLSNLHHARFRWLIGFLCGFTVIWSLSFINFIFYASERAARFPPYLIIVGIFLFSSGIVFMGWRQPGLFAGIPSDTPEAKYARNRIPPALQESYLERIVRHMETERPYLDPDFRLDSLAADLQLPAHHISQVLNSNMQVNFFQFVNSYRLKECCRRLSDPGLQDSNILKISLDCGFNSKSSFYSLFKKETGMTPVEFRNRSRDMNQKLAS